MRLTFFYYTVVKLSGVKCIGRNGYCLREVVPTITNAFNKCNDGAYRYLDSSALLPLSS